MLEKYQLRKTKPHRLKKKTIMVLLKNFMMIWLLTLQKKKASGIIQRLRSI
jgi:hypothetical protein